MLNEYQPLNGYEYAMNTNLSMGITIQWLPIFNGYIYLKVIKIKRRALKMSAKNDVTLDLKWIVSVMAPLYWAIYFFFTGHIFSFFFFFFFGTNNYYVFIVIVFVSVFRILKLLKIMYHNRKNNSYIF